MQQLNQWFLKSATPGLSINLGIFLRLLLHYMETIAESNLERSRYKRTLSSMEARAFSNAERLAMQIHERFSREILEHSEVGELIGFL